MEDATEGMINPERQDESPEPQPHLCQLCGEPMPPGELMFNYHGWSGPCPKPPLPRPDRLDGFCPVHQVGWTGRVRCPKCQEEYERVGFCVGSGLGSVVALAATVVCIYEHEWGRAGADMAISFVSAFMFFLFWHCLK